MKNGMAKGLTNCQLFRSMDPTPWHNRRKDPAMRSEIHALWISAALLGFLTSRGLAITYQVMDPSQTRTLNVVRHYEVAVQKGKPSAAAVPALMSFWGATNWQLVNSSRFSYSEEPDRVEVIADDQGMPRRSYKMTWAAPKADRITIEQTMDVELTCFNTLYTAARLPYAEDVRTRFADSLTADDKEGINPANPNLEPICDGIVKKCRTAEDVVQGVCNWINENITFVKGQRTADEALEQRQGSCTPMSRLACAMLRRIGIPTEMVSAKFIDSDNGHAFIEVYFPDAGWVFYDLSNWNRGFKSLDCLATVGWCYRSGPPENMGWHQGYFCVETDIRPYKEFSRKSSRVLSREPDDAVVAGVKVLSIKARRNVCPRHESLRQLLLDPDVPPGTREYAASKTEQPAPELSRPVATVDEVQDSNAARRWTSMRGTTVDALLISASDTQVVLQKRDGARVTVAIDAFCEEDREYIQNSRK